MKIELKNVSLKLQTQELFQNLNVQFEGPGIIGLVGPSGCGKSTLLRLLAGLQKPTTGEVIKPDLKSGFVFQESHLLNWRTSFENVALPLELQKKSNDQAVESALQAVSMWDAKDFVPSQLSGGMKMRVSLARAFVSNPDLLFCDEPFSALDELTREALQKYLRTEIMLHRRLCFFVTHSLTEALSISDHIYYFRKKGELASEVLTVKHNNAAQAEQLEWLKTRLSEAFK